MLSHPSTSNASIPKGLDLDLSGDLVIEGGARIYVCGDGARMEPDVRKALGEIYADRKDVSREQAELWIDEMIRDGRYALDVWVG